MSANFDNLVKFLFKSDIDPIIKSKLKKVHEVLNSDSEPDVVPSDPAKSDLSNTTDRVPSVDHSPSKSSNLSKSSRKVFLYRVKDLKNTLPPDVLNFDFFKDNFSHDSILYIKVLHSIASFFDMALNEKIQKFKIKDFEIEKNKDFINNIISWINNTIQSIIKKFQNFDENQFTEENFTVIKEKFTVIKEKFVTNLTSNNTSDDTLQLAYNVFSFLYLFNVINLSDIKNYIEIIEDKKSDSYKSVIDYVNEKYLLIH